MTRDFAIGWLRAENPANRETIDECIETIEREALAEGYPYFRLLSGLCDALAAENDKLRKALACSECGRLPATTSDGFDHWSHCSKSTPRGGPIVASDLEVVASRSDTSDDGRGLPVGLHEIEDPA